MTIYWLRCDVCGRHRPTMKCSMVGEGTIEVCPHCYVLLGLAEKCREKAWGIGLPARPEAAEKKTDKLKEIEDLLSMLEE